MRLHPGISARRSAEAVISFQGAIAILEYSTYAVPVTALQHRLLTLQPKGWLLRLPRQPDEERLHG